MINTACQCNAGYTGANGNTCSKCSINQYKAGLGSASCSDCPSNSVSGTGSITNTSCVCNARWNGPNGGPRLACAAGTYFGPAKNFARTCGSAQDVACPATMTPLMNGNLASYANDASLNSMVHSGGTDLSVLTLDFGRTRDVQYIRLYNRLDCCASQASVIKVRVGSDLNSGQNALCTTLESNNVQTFGCIGTGQYIHLTKNGDYINFMELETRHSPCTSVHKT